jgi:hypothetical protein
MAMSHIDPNNVLIPHLLIAIDTVHPRAAQPREAGVTPRDGSCEARAAERLASLPLCCQAWAAEAARQWARASRAASETVNPADEVCPASNALRAKVRTKLDEG